MSLGEAWKFQPLQGQPWINITGVLNQPLGIQTYTHQNQGIKGPNHPLVGPRMINNSIESWEIALERPGRVFRRLSDLGPECVTY